MQASKLELSGRSLIGFREGEGEGAVDLFYAVDPTTGLDLQPGFSSASAEEIELAARLAEEAFVMYRQISGRERGAFLRKIAANIEAIATDLIERAGTE